MDSAADPSPGCLNSNRQPMEKAGERQHKRWMYRETFCPDAPPRLLPPSHCLEINYKVTARREPSYRILTVPSCPLLERRWSVLYLQTFLFLFFLPPGGTSAKQKPQQQRNLNSGLHTNVELYSCVQYTQLDSGKRIASTHSQKDLLFSRTTFTHTTNRACHYTSVSQTRSWRPQGVHYTADSNNQLIIKRWLFKSVV